MDHEHRVELAQRWAWCERNVDPTQDHFELLYGPADDPDWSAWLPVARVGSAIERVFGVQFIINRAVPNSAAMINAVVAELDFYLVTKGEPNPWAYAQYHSGTSSNVYSKVHWSFHHGQSNDGIRP